MGLGPEDIIAVPVVPKPNLVTVVARGAGAPMPSPESPIEHEARQIRR